MTGTLSAARLRSLRFRLPLLLLLYGGLVGVSIYLIVDRTQERRFEEEFEARQLARATDLQERTERAAERAELEAAQLYFGELGTNEALRAAVFVTPDNRVLMTSRREWRNRPVDLAALGVPAEDGARVDAELRSMHLTRRTHSMFVANGNRLVLMLPAAMPVLSGATAIDRSAMILLVYDLSLSKAINTYRLRQMFALIAGAVVLAVFILGVALHFFVTRRLERIQQLIDRFASGESIDQPQVAHVDEIGAIGAKFNDMALTVRREMGERLDATAALRESEDKFRTAMRYSPIGHALMGPDGRFVEVNPALCEILGYSEDELIAKAFQELTHPDDLAESLVLNRQLMSGALETFQVEKRYRHKAGHYVWAQLNAAIVLRDGRPSMFVTQTQDITERKRNEERIQRANRSLRAISHCNQALVHATDEPSLLKQICRVIVEDGGYRLAWVAFARQEGVVAAAQWGEDHGYIAGTIEVWDQLLKHPGELRDFLTSGGTRVTHDFATDPFVGPWRDQALARGLRASATFALREGGRTFGALMIYADRSDAFDEQEMALLSEMAEDLAYGIQSLRTRTRHQLAEGALVANEALLRQLIKNTPAAVAMFDRDMRYLQASDRWLTDYRLEATEIIGRSHYAVIPDAPERWRAIHQRVLAGAVETCEEDALERTDGTIEWLQWEARPWHQADGSIGGLTMFTQVITDRKQTEAAMRATNERYARHEAALATLTRCHVQRPEEFPEVLRTVTEVVASTLEVSRVALWRRRSIDRFLCEDLFELSSGTHLAGREIEGPIVQEFARMLADSDVVSTNDIAADRRVAEFARTYFAGLDVRGFLMMPIRGQGDLIAVFSCVHVGEDRVWTRDEQTFAIAVANLVSSLVAQVDRLHLEAQLRQATKLEGIGQLAGGVAHDFNNVLTVILGKAGQLMTDPRLPADLREAVEDINQSGDRAANLTRQLLAFSRRQAMQVRDHDLNAVIRNVARLLDRILGEDLALELSIGPEPIYVRADAGMVDQVLLNLAVNARDAMRQGGRLLVETSLVNLDAHATAHVSRPPGPYACLRVSDTGSGISKDNLPHIFEPFFTTKDVGKGTGLGLATTYGIVQQHNGWIDVDSEIGKGTVFSIYFPSFTQPFVPEGPAEPAPARVPFAIHSAPGKETILVVEDEAEVRSLIVDALSGFGYRVLEARSGPLALELWREHGSTIDLIITDMVMPGGMNGLDLASQLKREHPGLRIIYISGYLADVSREELVQSEGATYLAKPFNLPTLARLVRESLDAVPHAKSR